MSPLKDPEARRAYHREYMRQRLANDPEERVKHMARVRRNDARYKLEKRAWLDAYLAEHPCVDCDENDPDVLDFDHVQGQKSANVSDLLWGKSSLKRLQAEVALCEVRCANCHRRITRSRQRELLSELGVGSGVEPETSGI